MKSFLEQRKIASNRVKVLAEHFRKRPSEDEKLMMVILNKNIKEKAKFQRVILGWIVDFYFPKRKLVIEVDNRGHRSKKNIEKDKIRDEALEKYKNIKTIRVTTFELYTEPKKVVKKIKLAYKNQKLT